MCGLWRITKGQEKKKKQKKKKTNQTKKQQQQQQQNKEEEEEEEDRDDDKGEREEIEDCLNFLLCGCIPSSTLSTFLAVAEHCRS